LKLPFHLGVVWVLKLEKGFFFFFFFFLVKGMVLMHACNFSIREAYAREL
jgi:hypothetical protein